MKEIDDMNEIRRKQFLKYVEGYRSQAELASKLGLSTGYINQLATGYRPITEKTALKFEKKLGLIPGYFSGNRELSQEQQDVLEAMKMVDNAAAIDERLDKSDVRTLYNLAIGMALDGLASEDLINAYIDKFAKR